MSAFHVDGRITLKMEYELAVRLGEYIMKTNPADKQIAAMAWRLARLSEDDDGRELPEVEWSRPSVPVAREEHVPMVPVARPQVPVTNSMRDMVASVKSNKVGVTNKVRWGY